ncbi:inositol monophosphatase [Helicobacter sp. MIT 21-1697]|uniref:inositol monophosphatase family protein n=1 Tax=Helicobacter sp. MIT 21-1697 TaxID=2993733 RepID=UPI00224ABAB1|nr:inositol monophosphatase family protein [Helicobacter sp. MIT 21-1697]MCX2717136.1 inositol monophosphatase [Helicobacter sp. MIT 21-1697]
MSEFLHKAILATHKIILALEEKNKALYITHSIGAGGDKSIGADLLSEQIYAEYLIPLANIDSEESGFINGVGNDCIVLDPLDGSDNFLSHIPYYGSSLALCDANDKVKEAVIFNFCAKEGFAHLGDKPFRFSIESYIQQGESCFMPLNPTPLGKCGIFEKAYCNPHFATLLYENHLKFRSLGASALSIAKSYEVNFMLFLGNIRKFDSKAGLFLCKQLHHLHTNNFTLISKDKHIFDIIYNLITHKG